MDHWKAHRPTSYAALEDQRRFFTELGEEAAAWYLAVRDQLLEGKSPNNGSIDWMTYQDEVARADQEAREIIEQEMIYLPLGEGNPSA